MKTASNEHRTVITVPKSEVKIIQKTLKRKKPDPDYKDGSVITSYDATFDDDTFVDIKICNGSGPYIDPVLFSAAGYEIAVGEPCWELLGFYEFEVEDEKYIVELVKR